MYCTYTFSYYMFYIFTFFMASFYEQMSSILIWSNLSILYFMINGLCVLFKKKCLLISRS